MDGPKVLFFLPTGTDTRPATQHLPEVLLPSPTGEEDDYFVNVETGEAVWYVPEDGEEVSW